MGENYVEIAIEICWFCLIQLVLYRWMEAVLVIIQNNRSQVK